MVLTVRVECMYLVVYRYNGYLPYFDCGKVEMSEASMGRWRRKEVGEALTSNGPQRGLQTACFESEKFENGDRRGGQRAGDRSSKIQRLKRASNGLK